MEELNGEQVLTVYVPELSMWSIRHQVFQQNNQTFRGHMGLAAGVTKHPTLGSEFHISTCKADSQMGRSATYHFVNDPAALKPHGIVKQGSTVMFRSLQQYDCMFLISISLS